MEWFERFFCFFHRNVQSICAELSVSMKILGSKIEGVKMKKRKKKGEKEKTSDRSYRHTTLTGCFLLKKTAPKVLGTFAWDMLTQDMFFRQALSFL